MLAGRTRKPLQPVAAAGAWSVYHALRAMAVRRSNPVLELLARAGGLRQYQKLPPEPLRFGGDLWRAYYHCHPVPDGTPGHEHGHFHLFVACEGGWTHLAALSMDREGQPLRWLMVNRWVTGSHWLAADALAGRFDAVVQDTLSSLRTSLVERWLLGMAALYHDELVRLMRRRDAALARHGRNRAMEAVLADRGIYTLAQAPVRLGARLEAMLYHEASVPRRADFRERSTGGEP